MRPLAAAAIVLGSTLAPAQSIVTITEAGLGYPVPLVVESQTPVDATRSYAGLMARHAQLALDHDHVTMVRTGTSLDGRSIYSYTVSTAATLTPEGFPKGAAVIQGTTHAREWTSPEVVTTVLEWLAQDIGTDSVAAYLCDAMRIVIHPIANPDAFLQTQRYPNQVVGGGSSGSAGNDGRMRRKNMRNSDELLSTTADAAAGVDLNRNHEFGWFRSSSSPTSFNYRGTTSGSEPESQALYAASALVPAARIRLFIDVHSFSQLYYAITDASATRNSAVLRCWELMSGASLATSGRVYTRIDTDLDSESIGAADEWFTGTFRAMGYTLETRPTGGTNGFLLPDAQLAQTRAELLAAIQSGLYYATGPASIVSFTVEDLASTPPTIIRSGVYTPSGTAARTVTEQGGGILRPGGSYRLTATFNKPLRRLVGGNWSMLPGIADAGAPAVGMAPLASAAGSFVPGGARWEGDQIRATFTVPANASGAIALQISGADAAATPIDGDPTTVADWTANGWVRAEPGAVPLGTLQVEPSRDTWIVR